jgi:hypothetical protein
MAETETTTRYEQVKQRLDRAAGTPQQCQATGASSRA